MTKNQKFVPITGLDNLSEEEKQAYYINCCEYYGIPAELNLLQFMWLDSNDGTGEKHLVLYAKRGATDLMRGTHGISVDEIKETLGDGFVIFTAKGHDKTGRTDIAVGSANLKGLSGKHLDNALMTAQTRATRRLTLQFVGGGLLDESEVQALVGGTVKTADAPVGPVGAAPVVQPSAAVGHEVMTPRDKEFENIVVKTMFSPDPPFEVEYVDPDKSRCKECGSSFNVHLTKCSAFKSPQIPTQPEPPVPVSSAAPTQEPLATQAQAPSEEPKKRRRRRTVSLEQPVPDATKPFTPEQFGAASPEVVPVLEPTVPNSGTLNSAQLASREALAKVTIPDDQIAQLEAELATLRAKKAYQDVYNSQKAAVENSGKNESVVQSAPPQPVVAIPGLPTEAQTKEFKARLFKYTNDVLRKGNMKGSEGIGGVEYKVRAFIRLMFPQTQEQKNLTVDQWSAFLGYMDTKHEELGPEGLVKLINEKIGAKE